MTTTQQGALEIDHDRGVIYFHDEHGKTIFRICRLPKPIPQIDDWHDLLDVTHMTGVSWNGIKSD